MKIKKADAILAADMHLRDTAPVCRIHEEFINSRNAKIAFIKELQQKHDCPILVAGDVFHNWDTSPELLAWTINNLPYIITTPGQHDLPNHNLDLLFKAPLAVLVAAKKASVLVGNVGITVSGREKFVVRGYPWGSKLEPWDYHPEKNRVALIHTLVTSKKLGQPWKDANAILAGRLMKKLGSLKRFSLVVSGDNHKAFCVRTPYGLLVNPGSIMRTTIDQVDFKPRVYLWYCREGRVEPVYLPIKRDAVIITSNKGGVNNSKISECINQIRSEAGKANIGFERYLELYFKKNKVGEEVRKMIYEAIEQEG